LAESLDNSDNALSANRRQFRNKHAIFSANPNAGTLKGNRMNLSSHRLCVFVGICLTGFFSSASAYTPPTAALSNMDKLRGYSELTTAAGSMNLDTYTYNLTTWQMTHGGFSKAHASLYVNPWDGKAELSSWTGTKSEPLGMFDNNATVQEMRLLAVRYKATTNANYKKTFKASFNKAVGFVLNSQLPNGGWPQVYPKRGNYSDLATYNDNAMLRVIVMVRDIYEKKSPFDSDILTSDSAALLKTAFDKAVAFTLKAQIVNGGKPTAWCQQHDPSTYKPAAARAYELPSKVASESQPIVWFLMTLPDQSTTVQNAVKGAIAWFKRTRTPDMKFSSGVFSSSPGASMWYRYYDVETDSFFFCDRDGIKTRVFANLSAERQTGYQWAGDYGSSILGLESAYLAALGTSSVIPTNATGNVASLRIGPDRIVLPVDRDGLYDVQFLDFRGAIRGGATSRSNGGVLETEIPSGSRHGIGFIRLNRQGESNSLTRRILVP
jgi:PelA/Pel-15E family pectate lyase